MKLSQFKPANTHWAAPYMQEYGADGFLEYSGAIFADLQNIPYGGEYNIIEKVDPEAYEVWIKIACWFIEVSPGWYMSEDYTTVKRLPYVDPNTIIRSTPKRDMDGGGEFLTSGESRENANERSGRKAG